MSRAEISGLVNLSDLQKLPVRAALFALITHLEMTMADAIRREFNIPDEWKSRLPPKRLEKMKRKREVTKADDNLVDDLLFTQFCDKTTIIGKIQRFTEAGGKFERDMSEAQDLRNSLAHANEYAATRENAAKICNTVRNIENWIAELSRAPLKQAPGEG